MFFQIFCSAYVKIHIQPLLFFIWDHVSSIWITCLVAFPHRIVSHDHCWVWGCTNLPFHSQNQAHLLFRTMILSSCLCKILWAAPWSWLQATWKSRFLQNLGLFLSLVHQSPLPLQPSCFVFDAGLWLTWGFCPFKLAVTRPRRDGEHSGWGGKVASLGSPRGSGQLWEWNLEHPVPNAKLLSAPLHVPLLSSSPTHLHSPPFELSFLALHVPPLPLTCSLCFCDAFHWKHLDYGVCSSV